MESQFPISTVLENFVTEAEQRLMRKEESTFQKMSEQAKQGVIDEDAERILYWQGRPDKYIKEVFDFNLWTCPDADDQLDIAMAIRDHSRVTVRSGNGPGKTGVAGRIALWFLYTFCPSIVITTAPTSRQVEKLLWGEMRKAHKTAKVDLGGQIFTTEIRLDVDWYAMGFSTDEPDRFQGFHSPHILVIVDEAGGVAEGIFEAIEGLLTTSNAKILLIGNPLDPTSYFGRTHLHPRESRGWVKLHIDDWNTPNVRAGKNLIPALVAHDWPQKKLEEWGEYNPFYQVRVKGEFPEAGDKNLIPYHMVHKALERSIPPAGRKVLSVDVAWFGNDKCVIARLHGNQFRILKKLYKQDGPALADNIMRVLKEGEEDIEEIKVDAIGYGSGCYDILKRKKQSGNDEEKKLLKRIKIIPVNVSEKSRDIKKRKDYYNIRAEAAVTVRLMFEQDQIDIDDEELGVQAANILYDFRDGRYLLEDKEKFKDRFHVSPDELDSLIIAKAIVSRGSPGVF